MHFNLIVQTRQYKMFSKSVVINRHIKREQFIVLYKNSNIMYVDTVITPETSGSMAKISHANCIHTKKYPL